MIDCICISGTMEDRVVEYVEYLHEHFYEPVLMRNGITCRPKRLAIASK